VRVGRAGKFGAGNELPGSVVEIASGFGIRMGINVTHQGDTIFATWFTYDAAGRPCGWHS